MQTEPEKKPCLSLKEPINTTSPRAMYSIIHLIEVVWSPHFLSMSHVGCSLMTLAGGRGCMCPLDYFLANPHMCNSSWSALFVYKQPLNLENYLQEYSSFALKIGYMLLILSQKLCSTLIRQKRDIWSPELHNPSSKTSKISPSP